MTLAAIRAAVTDRTRLIFLDNPNNPTGTLIDRASFVRFLRDLPETVIVVVDEAYVDFVDPAERIDILGCIREPAGIPAVVSLRTFSRPLAWPACGSASGSCTGRWRTCCTACANRSTSAWWPRPVPWRR